MKRVLGNRFLSISVATSEQKNKKTNDGLL